MFQTKDKFKKEFQKRLLERYGVTVSESHISERYHILGEMVRDYANVDWSKTHQKTIQEDHKTLIYFSMEFLIGRLLVNNMQNLGIYQVAKEGLSDLGIDIHEVEERESDAGLGNGGLGRLAACFLDSIASLSYPGHGNCIRYEYGFFKQKIVNGRQIEVPDQWLSTNNVWEIRKPKHAVDVKFYGQAETYQDEQGHIRSRTVNAMHVKAVPYDVPVIGYKNRPKAYDGVFHFALSVQVLSSDSSNNFIPFVFILHGDENKRKIADAWVKESIQNKWVRYNYTEFYKN
jgi:starch phosphorylase